MSPTRDPLPPTVMVPRDAYEDLQRFAVNAGAAVEALRHMIDEYDRPRSWVRRRTVAERLHYVLERRGLL